MSAAWLDLCFVEDVMVANLGPGRKLRRLRNQLGLTMRQVEQRTRRLAARKKNRRLILSTARLCDIEAGTAIPNIYGLYSLARIYRCDVREILAFYGLRS